MVMEAPSPQCVGREFVRQYYTLLHEAPDYLHRFYSHNSCFVHGGVEKPGEEQPPVQGQSEIHKKIVSLNFRDCHAKIRQVDSQATVGNAVVVQVTGELSNAGQPMRRFMQTFVLAPQSPKKYYVHNDIFRYQDEVFHDSDNDTETQEETGDSEPEQVEGGEAVEGVQDGAAMPEPQGYAFDQGPVQSGPQADGALPPLSNGSASLAPATVVSDERADEVPVGKVVDGQDRLDMEHEPVVAEYEPVPEPQETIPEPADIEEQSYDEPRPMEQKPFSWALMASKNSGLPPPPKQQQQHAPPAMPKPAPVPKPTVAPPASDKQATESAKPREPREQRPPRRSEPGRERDSSRPGAGGEQEDFRRSRFPDNQQLFVGNLPHSVSDKELKEQFEEYGKVLDVRINRKSNNRPDVPNFGFVVFDNPESVYKVLNSKPINTREGHRLNVEEKKQRSEQSARPGSGPSRPGPRGGGGSMGPRGGGMGPPRSDRGGRGGGMGPRPDMRGGSDRGRGGGGFGAPRR